jgi:pentose-5-phosphate-3-epimerase
MSLAKVQPEWLHVDVMDGHFVPNLTIGPPVVRALKQATTIPLDVHLMIDNPDEQLDWYLDAGLTKGDILTVHIEAAVATSAAAASTAAPAMVAVAELTKASTAASAMAAVAELTKAETTVTSLAPAELTAASPATLTKGTSVSISELNDASALTLQLLLKRIRKANVLAGISLNPATSVGVLEPLMNRFDVALLMSVHPGFGGQSFIGKSEEKIAELAHLRKQSGADFYIEVDGGINIDTATIASAAGADILVAGNAIFAAHDPLLAMHKIREAANERRRTC